MIFSENSQFGWGASHIAMPRVALELHPGRQRTTGEIVFQVRPGGAGCRWRSSHMARIFLDDYPWRRLLFLGMLSSIIIAYLYFLDLMLPRYQNQQRPKPVEIIVAMQKAEPRPEIIPEEQKPVVALAPTPVKAEVILEPVSKAPEKLVIEKPKEIKPEVPKKLPSEPKLPPVKIKPRVVPEKAEKPQRIASIAPAIDKPSKPENIEIPPPTVRKRNYAKKDPDKFLQPHQVRKTTDLKAASNTKLSEEIDVGGLRYVSKNNPLLAETQIAPSDTHPPVSFQARKSIQISNLKLKKSNRQVSQPLPPAPRETERTVAFSSSRTQDEFTGTQITQGHQTDKRYALTQSDRLQDQAAQRTNREITFPSQKLKISANLAPPVSNKLIGKANRSVAEKSNAIPKAHSFSANVAPAEVDPSDLISLQAFNVCKDPEREFRQKTQLAAHLLNATRVEVEGVVFFIKYTESGYTIEIHIYNPQGRSFKNRCEVLELALNRIVNRAN